MIHEIVVWTYRFIVLFVLGGTLWMALDEESDGYLQITAAILTIPLALRFLMIK
jgi:hypothetical protein